MILGPISLIDCVVFMVFLVPQLLYQVGLVATVTTVLNVLPFLGTDPSPSFRVRPNLRGIPRIGVVNDIGLTIGLAFRFPIALPARPGAVSYPETGAVAFRPAGLLLPGPGRPLRQVCVCKHPRPDLSRLLLQAGRLPVHMLSLAAPWLSELARQCQGGAQARSARTVDL
jgi:hypothetical protein